MYWGIHSVSSTGPSVQHFICVRVCTNGWVGEGWRMKTAVSIDLELHHQFTSSTTQRLQLLAAAPGHDSEVLYFPPLLS